MVGGPQSVLTRATNNEGRAFQERKEPQSQRRHTEQREGICGSLWGWGGTGVLPSNSGLPKKQSQAVY